MMRTHALHGLWRQVPAGIVVGLSAVIYAYAYGALLFSGPLAALAGFGITACLIAAVAGALLGLLSEEKCFIAGPDSNTISVLASIVAVVGALGLPAAATANLALAVILLTSLLSALVFQLVAHFRLAGLVRYIPFSVMAGILASTGWLMASGALNIITGSTFSMAGLQQLLADPLRPELGYGLAVVGLLFALASRVPAAVLIPAVMLLATLGVHLPPLAALVSTAPDQWLFAGLQEAPWLPPWQLRLDRAEIWQLLALLPSMLLVSFVGVLTILVSVASLELGFDREFDLERILHNQALASGAVGMLGGVVVILSIGRSVLNQKTRGGVWSGVIAALFCLLVLLGGTELLSGIARGALGGLLLYLGLSMLKQWVWDQRSLERLDFLEILSILVLVANFGFLVGFAAGVLIACMIFVVNYSRIPIAAQTSDLARFNSTVMRPQQQEAVLKQHGARALVYRLDGYIFFGSASKIDAMFRQLDMHTLEAIVLDFSRVSGIDRSAIGVFQRILRRYRETLTHFHFAHPPHVTGSLVDLLQHGGSGPWLRLHDTLDEALEAAEDEMLARHASSALAEDCLAFLDTSGLAHTPGFAAGTDVRAVFRSYCHQRAVAAGEILCREGEHSREAFFLEQGQLDIFRNGNDDLPLRLARMLPGAVTGELALVTGDVRTATVISAGPCSVLVLDPQAFARMGREAPALALQFERMVIGKLARTQQQWGRRHHE